MKTYIVRFNQDRVEVELNSFDNALTLLRELHLDNPTSNPRIHTSDDLTQAERDAIAEVLL